MVEFWFEFASTYSYIAASRIRGVAQAAQVSVRFEPFLLGPILADQGLETSPFVSNPAKGRYMWRDIERLCETRGLPFKRPSAFPRNGLLAARICCVGRDEPWMPPFAEAVYAANFGQDLDISDPELLKGILETVGAPAQEVITEMDAPSTKKKLREQTERARKLGIFGAPSFVVAGELYWGQDRLGDAIAHARLGG